MLPITVDGTTIPESPGNITIDGTDVTEVTVDGTAVWTANAIPASGLLHNYDWSDGTTTTSTVPDLAGSTDLTGTFTDLTATINGVQAGTFDGNNDVVDGDFADISQPYTIFTVARARAVDTDQYFYDGWSNRALFRYDNSDDAWDIYSGSTLQGSAGDTNAHLWTMEYNGASSAIRVDSAADASGDAGTLALDGLTVPQDSGKLVSPGAVDVGQIAVYNPDASGYSRSDVEDYFTGKWGPF